MRLVPGRDLGTCPLRQAKGSNMVILLHTNTHSRPCTIVVYILVAFRHGRFGALDEEI